VEPQGANKTLWSFFINDSFGICFFSVTRQMVALENPAALHKEYKLIPSFLALSAIKRHISSRINPLHWSIWFHFEKTSLSQSL
jgi:hypothetical protein